MPRLPPFLLAQTLRPALACALLLLSWALYFWGLGSAFAPTNGDEMVYLHIARMTAESGQWLPLQSELLGTRNTKPPLLIWQAMVAGGWGSHWDLFWLRLPSVLYTTATTAGVVFFTYQWARLAEPVPPAEPPAPSPLELACLAGALYLLCFSTFRYGRAYLTSAPETFWLALPMWWLGWKLIRAAQTRSAAVLPMPGWGVHTGFGLCLGLGAAYKSFALLAPAAAALGCVYLALCVPWSTGSGWRAAWPVAWQSALRLGWSVLLGLGLFALWFVLDPDPQAVWQEFVVAENAGKMSGARGYWHAALFGDYPMWTQLLAYPANAGLLALVALGFCLQAARAGLRRRVWAGLSPFQWWLLLWLLVWLVVFTIPSQRSERYVIPAMPALAIAMALGWQRLGRAWAWATLLLCLPALVMLGRIGWVLSGMGLATVGDTARTLTIATAGGLVCLLGLLRWRWAGATSLWAVLSVLACFHSMVRPLDAQHAAYGQSIAAPLQGARVAVPNGFTGQYERFHFLLPQARLFPYDAEGRNTGERYPEMPPDARLARLLSEFDAVIWLDNRAIAEAPPCAPQCRALDWRWHVRSRHKAGEVTLDNLWYPQQWLFGLEWTVVPAR